jgi:hypothetical protein
MNVNSPVVTEIIIFYENERRRRRPRTTNVLIISIRDKGSGPGLGVLLLVGDTAKLTDLFLVQQRFTNGEIITVSEARHGCNDEGEDRHVNVRQTRDRQVGDIALESLGMSSVMFFYPVFCYFVFFFR